MQTLPQIFTVILVVSGILSVVLISKRPALFWPVLVVFSILGAGPMIKGHAIVDEFLLLCLLLGVLIVLMRKHDTSGEQAHERSMAEKVHITLFLVFVTYLALQSVRGMFILDDLRMVRFIALYTMLGALGFVVSKRWFPVPDPNSMAKIVVVSGAVYFLSYLLIGIFAEYVEGVWRYESQGAQWVGTSVAVFPALIVLPSITLLLRRKSGGQVHLCLATITLMFVAGLYYSSRILESIMLFLLLFLFVSIRFKRFLPIFLIYIVVFSLFSMVFESPTFTIRHLGSITTSTMRHLESIAASSMIFFGTPRESDNDRFLQFKAAMEATKESPWTVIVGRGYYAHKKAMVPYVKRLQDEAGMRTGSIESVRPATFLVLLVDTGLLGIGLFIMNIIASAYGIISNYPKDRVMSIILLVSLTGVFLTTLLSQNYTTIIFYMAFMPFGFLVRSYQRFPVPANEQDAAEARTQPSMGSL